MPLSRPGENRKIFRRTVTVMFRLIFAIVSLASNEPTGKIEFYQEVPEFVCDAVLPKITDELNKMFADAKVEAKVVGQCVKTSES